MAVQLYPHQVKALQETERFNKVGYFLDMGLGKTFVGSEKAKELKKPLLLVCQKSKIEDWVTHLVDNSGYDTFDLTDKKELERFINVLQGDKEVAALTAGVINYELVWRRPELLNIKNFTLMLDESSLIQNKTAKQTKFILKLDATNVILLSGTPTSGKYENLWTQCHLLGWDISEKLYQRQYVNWNTIQVSGGQFVKVVDKKNPYKNVERLKSKLREHGATFLKTEDVMNLPEQTFIEVNISKPKYYDKFMKDSIVAVDGVEMVGDTSLTKRLYARELCGIYSEAKLDAFRDIVYSTNDRLIVFYNFNEELSRLGYCLNDRPISIVNGQKKDLTAYENYNDSITFVQYQAGAKGLNLQKANKIVYYSPTVKCDDWMQSQKRIHRIGQQRPCFYYKLICKGTVEEDIYRCLESGVDWTDRLFEYG